jgi:hypothetical protein
MTDVSDVSITSNNGITPINQSHDLPAKKQSPVAVINSNYIQYFLSDGSPVLVEIVNIQGKTIITPCNEYQASGLHHMVLKDNYKLEAGIYLVKIRINNLTLVKRIIIH